MKTKISKLALPHRYRKHVVQILANKGFEVTPHDVSNIIRGRVSDPEKTALVLAAVRQVSRAHVRIQKQRAALLGRA